jgi:hypothetical protein
MCVRYPALSVCVLMHTQTNQIMYLTYRYMIYDVYQHAKKDGCGVNEFLPGASGHTLVDK